MKKAISVDGYIAAAPQEVRKKLEQIRKAIRAVAPEAEERISYSMPYYGYNGRLAYFAYAKKHIGLYIPPPVIRDHDRELAGYETAVSAVRFPLDRDLPLTLIQKLVRARMKINRDRAKKNSGT